MFLKFFVLLLSISSLYAAENHLFFSKEMMDVQLKTYNEQDLAALEKDLAVVRSVCLSDVKKPEGRNPVYIASAGAPGSRKTTILERFIYENPEFPSLAYLDPDPRALRLMPHTYYQLLSPRLIAESKDYGVVLKNAYDKWRYGSTYVTLKLIEEAFSQRVDIAHGTTSTGAHLGRFFPALKQAGYQVILLLCSCEDDLRIEAITHRNENIRFYQSAPEDAIAKGKLFPERMPAYFEHADRLYFYWSDALFEPERLAATFHGATFEILDKEAYEKFVSKYEADRLYLMQEGKSLPSFAELVSARMGNR